MKFKTQFACCTVAAMVLMAYGLIELAPAWGQVSVPSEELEPAKTPAKPVETVKPGVQSYSSDAFGYSNAAPDEKPKKKYLYSLESMERGGRGRDITAQTMIHQATQKYKAAKSDEEKATAQKEMSAALSGFFDEDMKNREAGIVKIEERVKKLRAQLEKRSEAKDRLVDLQVQLLINEANGLGFYSSPNSQSFGASWYGGRGAGMTPRWAYDPQDSSSGTMVYEESAPRGEPKIDAPDFDAPIRTLAPAKVPTSPRARSRRGTDPNNTTTYEKGEVPAKASKPMPIPSEASKPEEVPDKKEPVPAKPEKPVPAETKFNQDLNS